MKYEHKLFPEISPYETGMLEVGGGHSIYYERVGTPGAKPAVFLHGGPGAGITVKNRRQWNPELYDVLLFDQRGCGKSRPFASIVNNDTWSIVSDIEALRKMCGVQSWQVLGGSWGSTLALSYAQAHPDSVDELILRGVFLARQKEKNWLYKFGASEIMPEAWERFTNHIPSSERIDLVRAYYNRLTDEDDSVKTLAAKQWSLWEGNLATLLPDPELLRLFIEPEKAVPFARICAKFFLENFYLEEGELIENIQRMSHLPGIIIQGRHDICTPPIAAWDLKKVWNKADLRIISDAGHSAYEPGIIDGLVRATNEYAK